MGRSNLMPGEENFFTNRVVASLRHDRQIAAEAERAIEQLTVKQVVVCEGREDSHRTGN